MGGGGGTDTVRESALKVDSGEKNPLPHWGIEPTSMMYRSDVVPTELHPAPLIFHFIYTSIAYQAARAIAKTMNTNQSYSTLGTKMLIQFSDSNNEYLFASLLIRVQSANNIVNKSKKTGVETRCAKSKASNTHFSPFRLRSLTRERAHPRMPVSYTHLRAHET